MSDEALSAHLQWLDDCAKETDYETWLEEKVALLEVDKDRLLEQLVDGEELYISRGIKLALLEAKLAAIECGDCHKTMLECACDE